MVYFMQAVSWPLAVYSNFFFMVRQTSQSSGADAQHHVRARGDGVKTQKYKMHFGEKRWMTTAVKPSME